MRMTERARAALAEALEARNDGLWEAMRSELQAESAEAAFWFHVSSPSVIGATAALLSELGGALRDAYDETALSAGFVTALPDGVLLWESLSDAEIRGEAAERPFGLVPQTYALSEFGPGAELFPIEIPPGPEPGAGG